MIQKIQLGCFVLAAILYYSDVYQPFLWFMIHGTMLFFEFLKGLPLISNQTNICDEFGKRFDEALEAKKAKPLKMM